MSDQINRTADWAPGTLDKTRKNIGEISEQMYNRDIEIAQKNALNEMAEEVYQRVMKSLQVEVRNEASPAIKELKKEIDNLFKK